MRRPVVLSVAMLVLVCLVSGAWAETPEEAAIHRFLGGWLNEDFNLYIRQEDDELICMVSRYDDASGDTVYWEFTPCVYQAEDDSLLCPTCVHYREHIDMETYEMIQEDWLLISMEETRFAFGDDEDMLIGSDIHDVDDLVAFRRAGDEVSFDLSN